MATDGPTRPDFGATAPITLKEATAGTISVAGTTAEETTAAASAGAGAGGCKARAAPAWLGSAAATHSIGLKGRLGGADGPTYETAAQGPTSRGASAKEAGARPRPTFYCPAAASAAVVHKRNEGELEHAIPLPSSHLFIYVHPCRSPVQILPSPHATCYLT